MTPLAVLLSEIWEKDNTLYIEQAAYSRNVVLKNEDESVCVETASFAQTVMDAWKLFYGKEQYNDV